MKKLLSVLLMLVVATAAFAEGDDDVAKLKKKINDLNKRLRMVEVKAAKDRMEFTGDFRFEAHNLDYEVSDHYDGMALQNLTAGAMFYMTSGNDPQTMTLGAIQSGMMTPEYALFANNLTFDELKQFMGGFSPEQQMGLMQQLLPATYREGYDWRNDVLYTNRLRLNMNAKVADNVDFQGRLTMYKPWGDSTGLQVFNGQSNSLNMDGNSGRIPGGDVVRVERAYFNWRNIGDTSLYLSFGRRPSADGPPTHLRNDELRAGTPLGTVIDFAFDGITAGFSLAESSKFRLCYGLGYESGFGGAQNLQRPENHLRDAHFFGVNWDAFVKDGWHVQTTVARAFDVTDGFNGLVVLPDNPVSGDPIGAPMAMRFAPSANLGDIDLFGFLVMKEHGPFDVFASYQVMKSHPNATTTPFGGLFSDPFETPEERTGKMAYAGARYRFADDETKLGLEYNKGNQYWFNFSHGADDVFAPKTSTRGDVWEMYITHRIAKKFVAKLNYMLYDYEYSGSGWHLGAPKALDATPIVGYPSFDKVAKIALSLSVRF